MPRLIKRSFAVYYPATSMASSMRRFSKRWIRSSMICWYEGTIGCIIKPDLCLSSSHTLLVSLSVIFINDCTAMTGGHQSRVNTACELMITPPQAAAEPTPICLMLFCMAICTKDFCRLLVHGRLGSRMRVVKKAVLDMLDPAKHDLVRGRHDHRQHYTRIVHEPHPGRAGLNQSHLHE